jgi:ABC-type bacteriocin/lantibiotic exporter with double-glycine peptidase domain
MNYEEFLSMNISVRNSNLEHILESKNLKNLSVILNDTIDTTLNTPKSPKPENYLIHDADEHQENTIIEPFFDKPETAVKTALNLNKEIKITNDNGQYILNELWSDTTRNTLAFCLIDDIDKTIKVYRNKYTKDNLHKDRNNIVEYPVLILLKKNHKFTYYYYNKHNMYKVQKVWNYKRIIVNEEYSKQYTKKTLMEMAKEDIYKNQIKSSMKKQEIYNKMCGLNFEFY